MGEIVFSVGNNSYLASNYKHTIFYAVPLLVLMEREKRRMGHNEKIILNETFKNYNSRYRLSINSIALRYMNLYYPVIQKEDKKACGKGVFGKRKRGKGETKIENERKREITASFYIKIDKSEDVARVLRNFPEDSKEYCKLNGFYVVPYESITGDIYNKGDYGITHCMFLSILSYPISGNDHSRIT